MNLFRLAHAWNVITAKVCRAVGLPFGASPMHPSSARHRLTGRAALPLAFLLAPIAAFAVPPTPGTVVADDSVTSTNVKVLYSQADNTANCSNIQHFIVRNGADLAMVNTTVGPYSTNYIDTTAVQGVTYNYALRSNCLSSGQSVTGPTDSGRRALPLIAPTGVTASDGTYPGMVRVTFNRADNTASCTNIQYIIERGGMGWLLASTNRTAGTEFGDVSSGLTPGFVYNWTVAVVCDAPVDNTTRMTSASDPGHSQAATPNPPTGVSATDGAYTDRVVITFNAPDQTAACSGTLNYQIFRDGSPIGTLPISATGGSGNFSDTTADPGPHDYHVQVHCAGMDWPSTTDSGYMADPVPLDPSNVTATDGAFTDRIRIQFDAPDQTGRCLSSVNYYVMRNGSDISIINTIPLSGSGANTFDDMGVSFGVQSYAIRAECVPGSTTSLSGADTGYRIGTASAPSAVAASDGTYSDRVRVTWSAPAQAECSSVNYIVSRNGGDITTVTTIPVGGGAGLYDDYSVPVGTHSYAVRAICAPGGSSAASGTDTGYKNPVPLPVTPIATDGTFTDKINISFTGPDQSAVCSAIQYVIVRDGTNLTTISTVPLTGGGASFDDTTATVGFHSYSVRSECAPFSTSSVSGTDTGYWRGTPAAPTALGASDATFTTKVAVTWTAPDQSSQCSSISYVIVRDAVDVATVNTVPLTGGAAIYDDLAAPLGSLVYSVRAVCTPGNATASSGSDVGSKQPTSATPTAVSATDYTLLDRVTVTSTIGASTACVSVDAIISRDGSDIVTIPIPVAGQSISYDDMAPAYGLHTYAVRTRCDYGTGTNQSASIPDAGARRYPALSCGTLDVPSGVASYPGATFTSTARSVLWASSVRIAVAGQPNGPGDLVNYGTTKTVDDYASTVLLSNHASGSPEYGTFDVSVLATGMNPGDTEQVCTTTTLQVYEGCTPVTLSGPKGSGPLPATITWNSAGSTGGYEVYESPLQSGPYTLLTTTSAATTSYTIPGWPKRWYKVTCLSPLPTGNSTSAADEFWGNPPPTILGQTFMVDNPGNKTIYPAVADPEGNSAIVLSLTVPPANGTVTISGLSFTYTPNLSFAGTDPFTIAATDDQGAFATAVFTASVQLVPPDMPNNVRATDGTRLTDVQITWNPVDYATEYEIFIGNSATDLSPVSIAVVTAPLLTWDHVAAVPSQQRWYSVRAFNGNMYSARSVADPGVRDTPPVNLSASGMTAVGTALDMTPDVDDPDPGEVLVFAVDAQPANGTASVVGGKYRYLPNPGFVGIDTFAISVADRASATTTGVATVDVICPDQTAAQLNLRPTRTFAGSGYRVSLPYDGKTCPSTFTATFTLLNGTTAVDTQVLTGLPSGTAETLNFDLVAPSQIGTYTARVVLKNDGTGNEITRTAILPVDQFRMPTAGWNDTSAIGTIETATLSTGPINQCIPTTDISVAQADPSRCLLSLTGAPAEVVLDTGTGNARWSGVPMTEGSYPAVLTVTQYDSLGSARQLGTVTLPLTVYSPTSVSFTAPTSLGVKRAIGTYSITPVQTAGPTCPVYATTAAAASFSSTGKRSCYITWNTSSPSVLPTGDKFQGAIFDMTPVSVGWTANFVRPDQSLASLSSGTTVVTPTDLSMAFNLVASPVSPVTQITTTTVALQQTGTDKCASITLDDTVASVSSARPCLVTFAPVTGMIPDPFGQSVSMKGKLQASPATFGYTVSSYFAGVKYDIFTGSQDIVSVSPSPPGIEYQYARMIAPDVYAVSTLGGSMGVLFSDTSMGDLVGHYQASDAAIQTDFALFGAKRRTPILASPAPLYSVRTLDATIAYAQLTGLSTSRTVTIVAVPRDGLRLTLMNTPLTVPDTDTFTATVGIQEITANGLAYVAANAGAWMVEFGETDFAGTFTPMTAPIQTDADGKVSAVIDPTGKQLIRLTARARPVSGSTGYTTNLMARTQIVSVVKGTPIDGTIDVTGPLSGPAPYLVVMRAKFTTRADQITNVGAAWFTSPDGSTWTQVPNMDTLQYGARFPVGQTYVRVRFKNRNTQEESYSPPVIVVGYPVPKVTLSGPTYLLPSNPGTIDATATDAQGTAMVSPAWSWELQRTVSGSTPIIVDSGSGVPITLSLADSGIYRLIVKARESSVSASDPRSWGTAMVQIVAGLPAKPSLRITGPMRVETGTTATYTGSASTTFQLDTSNLTIAGEWTLPDGSIVPGNTLNWNPTASDMATGANKTIAYSAWIVGYESTTRQTALIKPTLWEYVWPAWKLNRSLGSSFAPSAFSLTAMPLDISTMTTLQGLTYSWTVPASIQITNTPTSKLTGIINFGGSHDVQLTVGDARGNSATVTETFVMGDPPALVTDITATNITKWAHAPLTLSLTTKTTGGHPLDRVSTWSYFIDAAPQSWPNQYAQRIVLDNPGTYDVQVQVATTMGASASKSVSIVVPANQPPSCSLVGVISTTRRSVALNARCLDPDGYVANYKWFVNGTPVNMLVAGSWTYILPTGNDLPISVEVQATDNGGLVTSSSASFN